MRHNEPMTLRGTRRKGDVDDDGKGGGHSVDLAYLLYRTAKPDDKVDTTTRSNHDTFNRRAG